jgi:hypothetical protein
MKFLKLAVAAILALSGTSASAQFHAGGVAACEGCHVMHNASGGQATTVKSGSTAGLRSNATNSYLLQGSDQSSTCLICHGGNGQQHSVANFATGAGPNAGSTASTNFTPGGDFGWLMFAGPNSGNRKAHNVVAKDYTYSADSLMPTAPGGTFTSGSGKAAFACSNCHDPHGRYRLQGAATAPDFKGPTSTGLAPITGTGSYGAEVIPANTALGVYRLLAGAGYSPASNPSFPFPNDPPSAVAPMIYNQVETAGEVRVAYGQGMSEWCQNCHTNIHLDGYVTGAPGLRHPAGNGAKLQPGQFNVYNTYISSGNLNGVNRYSSLVPFESGYKDITSSGLKSAVGNNVDPSIGTTPALLVAGASSNVMCISCHRAHGSGFDSITRWDNNASTTFLSNATTLNASGLDATTTIVAYYGRAVGGAGTNIGPFQRSLCNKCHGKD